MFKRDYTRLCTLLSDDVKNTVRLASFRALQSWGLAFITLFTLSYLYGGQSGAIIGWLAVISICYAYAYYTYSLHTEFSTIAHSGMLKLVILYTSVTLLIIIIYASYYFLFDLVTGENWTADFHNAVYFSVVTFTTLGFGEFVPGNTTGKYIVASEAIIGTLHMITFISVWLAKVVEKRA